MLRPLTLLAIALTLISCGGDIKEAKQLLKENIGRHQSLEFRNIQTFPGEVVCGEYLVNHTAQHQPFIYAKGMIYKQPSDVYLAFFCSQTPSDVLLESAGIGPYNASNAKLAQVTEDLTTLTAALESYYHNQFFYPTAEQGLQALISAPDNIKNPQKYPAQGYLRTIPLDPWGHPYLYSAEQWGGSKGSFTITTLGANGIAGGIEDNADISTQFLVRLHHLSFIVEQQTGT